jgi:hypothetical protein
MLPVRLLQPTHGELEVLHFGCEQLQSFQSTDDLKVLSLPIIFFIDDFGIHRNMYRAIKNLYWIPAWLPASRRSLRLEYDIIGQARSHFDTIFDREYATEQLTGEGQRRFLINHGMRTEQSPIVELGPTLDLIYGRGYDAPHSEWRGIGRILQGLLFGAILTKAGSAAYLKAFQSFPFPPGWPRIQSPVMYIWSLTEAGRLRNP